MQFKNFDKNPIEDFHFLANVYTLDFAFGGSWEDLKTYNPINELTDS